jgi:tetratricopeptide (TPR) repeat protein
MSDPAPQTFTLDALARTLNVSPERLRSWVRAGLVRPTRAAPNLLQFDFRQVSAAKTLCDLLAAGVTLGRIRRSLSELKQWKPSDLPLEQLAILERTGVLLVRLDEECLAETNGQYYFDFSDKPQPGESMRIMPGPRSPEEWFDLGLCQEQQGELAEAAGSYRKSLLEGGPREHVCFALANVLRLMGERQQSVERYLQVVELNPLHSDAWNNLGLCLDELGNSEEAAGAFRRALAADPDNWRAHYNLADVLEQTGQTAEALTHWRQYLRHDHDSEQATYARQRLAALKNHKTG